NIKFEKYVIMPNHIHLIVNIESTDSNGASGSPLPTNSVLSRHIGTLKRFCNKQIGDNIWQTGFYDHIIRNEEDYLHHLQYIEENPKKWIIGKDEYYI
ncbi:MAG: transposase, partial [Eubacterium sp.]|nr:transposase [Eubacterium sp.]